MVIGISGKIGTGKDTVGKIIQNLTAFGDDLSPRQILHTYELTGNFPINPIENTFEIKKFAAKLKQIVCILTGCTMDDLENQEFKSKQLPDAWWTYKGFDNGKFKPKSTQDLSEEDLNMFIIHSRINMPTYRWLLQVIGTESMREIVGENVWVNALFSDYTAKYFPSSWPPAQTNLEYSRNQGYPDWIITDVRFPNELKAIKDRGGITIRLNRNVRQSGLDTHPSETALDKAKFDYVIDNSGSVLDLIIKVENILKTEKII